MTKKGKNLTWALPLQAVALCCCRKSVINESLSSYMDILFRHIKPVFFFVVVVVFFVCLNFLFPHLSFREKK